LIGKGREGVPPADVSPLRAARTSALAGEKEKRREKEEEEKRDRKEKTPFVFFFQREMN